MTQYEDLGVAPVAAGEQQTDTSHHETNGSDRNTTTDLPPDKGLTSTDAFPALSGHRGVPDR